MDQLRLGFHPERLSQEVMQQLDMRPPAQDCTFSRALVRSLLSLAPGLLALAAIGGTHFAHLPTKLSVGIGAGTFLITSPLLLWTKTLANALLPKPPATQLAWHELVRAVATDDFLPTFPQIDAPAGADSIIPSASLSFRFLNAEGSAQKETLQHLRSQWTQLPISQQKTDVQLLLARLNDHLTQCQVARRQACSILESLTQQDTGNASQITQAREHLKKSIQHAADGRVLCSLLTNRESLPSLLQTRAQTVSTLTAQLSTR